MPWQAQTYSIYENFSFLFFFWEGGGGLSSTDRSIRVCLVGVKTRMMKNREKKIGWKMLFSTIWLEKENRKDKKQETKFSPLGPLF